VASGSGGLRAACAATIRQPEPPNQADGGFHLAPAKRDSAPTAKHELSILNETHLLRSAVWGLAGRSRKASMDKAFDLYVPSDALALAPALVERAPQALIKEFVRRPAKGWLDGTPLRTARLDDTLTGREPL